ncbi:MAG: M20/M25/M40 family metallo-hydrolase, partial [Candidatus Eremiobacterota bacterium]
MRLALLWIVALACGALAAPSLPECDPDRFPASLRQELVRLRDAALTSDYAYAQLSHLCRRIGPRFSGTPQAEAAVDHVAAEMRRLGLQVRLEECQVPHWVRGVEQAELVEFPGQVKGIRHPVVLTTLGGSLATPPEGVTAPVLVVASFAELEALNPDQVKGKIVLFNYPFDERMAAAGQGVMAYALAAPYRVDGPSAAGALGAVACLVRSVGGARYRLPHTGTLDYAADQPRIPAAAVAAEDAEWIADLSRQGPVQLHLVLTPRDLPPVVSHNVIADIPGSELPEQVVIVSGHLDSWDVGTGALDDGAGVVMAMQTAELVQRLGLKPRRTLRVVAWMNEENGLAGGKTYARNHSAAEHFAVIESD